MDLRNILHTDTAPSEGSTPLSDASYDADGSQTDFTDLDTIAGSPTVFEEDRDAAPIPLILDFDPPQVDVNRRLCTAYTPWSVFPRMRCQNSPG